MYKIIILTITILLMTGCSTLETSVDYNEKFDFTKTDSFTVLSSNKGSKNSLFNDRVINALEKNLKQKNYTKTDENNADLIFVFHSNVKDKTQLNNNYQTIGYGRYGYGGRAGMMMSTASTYEYKEGTLVIDALDPKTQKIVWRGTASKELQDKETPQERTQAVNKVISDLMKKFPVHK